jgi:hypothetical protein
MRFAEIRLGGRDELEMIRGTGQEEDGDGRAMIGSSCCWKLVANEADSQWS